MNEEKGKAYYSIDRESGVITVDFPDGQHRDYGYKSKDGWTNGFKELFERRIKRFAESDEFVLCDDKRGGEKT